jgi:hypothetical protein
MIDRARGSLGIVVAAALLLAIEAVSFRSGTTGKVVIGAVVVLIALLLFSQVDMYRIGLASALIAAVTLPWNGVMLGGLKPGDALVLVAIFAFLLADAGGPYPRLPWWVTELAFVIVLVAVLHELVPTDPTYINSRLVVNAGGKAVVPNYSGLLSNLGASFKFLVGIVAVPIAFAFPAIRDKRAPAWMATAYCLGAGASGGAALVDRFVGAGIGGLLTGLPRVGGSRQPGFSMHPNFLAAGCALAVPIAIWMIVSLGRRQRWLGVALLIGNAGGIYASGSRGGAVALVLALVLSLALMPGARRFVLPVTLGAATVVAALVALFPSTVTTILHTTRLTGDTGGSASNFVRAMVARQGWADFHHRPLDGIGMQVATEASNVYIQELASGGLLLFFGLSLYMLGAMWASYKLMPETYLAGALLVTLIVAAALNYVEADLTDRFYYVPGAVVVAMLCTKIPIPARDDSARQLVSADAH